MSHHQPRPRGIFQVIAEGAAFNGGIKMEPARSESSASPVRTTTPSPAAVVEVPAQQAAAETFSHRGWRLTEARA